jgi:hypothetical protein
MSKSIKLAGYEKDGFLSSLSIRTPSGLELFTKDLVWISKKECNKIICQFMIFAEEIGVERKELDRVYMALKQFNYELEPEGKRGK